MALIVQKYGGTSVGSIERINSVAEKIIRFREKGWRYRARAGRFFCRSLLGNSDLPRRLDLDLGIVDRRNQALFSRLAGGEVDYVGLLWSLFAQQIEQ